MEKRKKLGRKGGLLGGAGVLVVAGLFFLNTFVLAGERIHRESLRLGSSLEWDLDPAQGEHTLELYSRRKVSVRLQVAGPEGEELYSHRELAGRKGSRCFHFTPRKRGTHTISLGRGGVGIGFSSERCTLSLYINDRRLSTWL